MALPQENGTLLRVVQGNLANAKTDVIVNPVGAGLDFSGGAVSQVLLQQAGSTTSGWTLQSALRKKCPAGIGIGDVIDTSSGDLCCKKVYHCSARTWNEAKDQCEGELRQLVKKCLEKAHNEAMTSISFPAIGTGAAGVPLGIVANLMFEQVEVFCRQHKQTTLKIINIVLYRGDEETIKVFKKYIHMKRKSLPATLSQTTCTSDVEHGDEDQGDANAISRDEGDAKKTSGNSDEYVEESSDLISMPVMKNVAEAAACGPARYGRVMDIGNINVQVKQCDLVKETSDAIVNTTNINFSAAGAVSEKIFQTGGPLLKEECDQLKQIKDDVAVTSAGGLPSRFVIHIAAPKKQDDWYNLIKKTLKLAEKRKMTSISFPALGTGVMGISPAAIADIMVRAISSHALKHNKTLRTIYICVYKPEMMPTFERALDKDHSQDVELRQPMKKTSPGTTLARASTAEPGSDIASGDVVRPKTSPSIHVYASITTANYSLDDLAQAIAKILPAGTGRDSLPAVPSHWTTMRPDAILEVVKLKSSSEEYKKVEQSVLNDIKCCTIKQIDRIQNRNIHVGYTTLQMIMRKPNERTLWHGTSSDAVDSINRTGFDRQHHGKNGTKYGKGTYFAMSPNFAKDYTSVDAKEYRRVYQCKVLTGEYTNGDKDILSLPAKNPKEPVEKQVFYDSLVDNVNSPNIFVIFHDNQAYPEYLITFKLK